MQNDDRFLDATLWELPCSTCGGLMPFEQPECADGHGTDCPEWCCVRCGEALLIGSSGQALAEDATSAGRRADAA
ncbi:MAG: hypothetical protein WCA46_21095 [Actinocatenispora sp.]